MRTLLLPLNLLFLIPFIANGQKGNSFIEIHGSAETTTGFFAEGYKTGYGIYAIGYGEINKSGNISVSIGVASWNVKNGTGSAGMILPRIGYRQFVVEGLYLLGDIGVSIGIKNFKNSTRFVIGGGLGYMFKNKSGSGFNLSTRINRGFNRTWIGLGAGYQFKL